MEMKAWIICFIISFACYRAYAIGEHESLGGTAAGLGYTSVTSSDEWSTFNNQAGLAWCNKFSASLYVENRFLLADLCQKALAITLPVGRGSFGFSFRYFGFPQYSESNPGIAFGMRLTKRFAAGIQIDCLHLHIADGFKDNNALSCEMGLQFRASEHLWMGLHVANPIPVKISSMTNDRLSSFIQFGLSWKISDKLHFDSEVEKDITDKPLLKAGIEYRPANHFYLRMGVLTCPTLLTYGIGLEFGHFQIDLASSYHLILGYSPQASVTYFFQETKKRNNPQKAAGFR
jgi:hypothetical protein